MRHWKRLVAVFVTILALAGAWLPGTALAAGPDIKIVNLSTLTYVTGNPAALNDTTNYEIQAWAYSPAKSLELDVGSGWNTIAAWCNTTDFSTPSTSWVGTKFVCTSPNAVIDVVAVNGNCDLSAFAVLVSRQNNPAGNSSRNYTCT